MKGAFMAHNSQSLTARYDSLPFVVRLLLQIFLGWLASGIYRIVKFTETKQTTTLIVGILALIPGPDMIAWVADLVTLAVSGRITLFAD